jgi:hypothetical protein
MIWTGIQLAIGLCIGFWLMAVLRAHWRTAIVIVRKTILVLMLTFWAVWLYRVWQTSIIGFPILFFVGCIAFYAWSSTISDFVDGFWHSACWEWEQHKTAQYARKLGL